MRAEARVWKLKIAPRIRYLRWAQDRNYNYFAPPTIPNQAELLVSISF
ncbi:MAG: hypothetical protein ABSH45_01450 [Bryobacteraceae bacterium]